jgi:hypothetical protein
MSAAASAFSRSFEAGAAVFDFLPGGPHLHFMMRESFTRYTVHAGQIPARA